MKPCHPVASAVMIACLLSAPITQATPADQPTAQLSTDRHSSLLLSLGQAALLNNPLIQSARTDVMVKEQEREIARQQFMPTPSISIDKADQPSRTQLNQRSTIVRLQQPLWTGGRLTATLSIAELAIQSSHQTALSQEQSTLEQLIQAVSRYRQAQQRSQSLGDSVRTHERLLAQVARRVNEGLSPPSDLTVAESRLLNVRADRQSAETDMRQQILILQRLIGRPLEPSETGLLTGESTDGSNLPLMSNAVEDPFDSAQRQPRLRKLEADRLSLEHRIRAVKANRQPQLSVRLDRIQGDVSGTDHVAVFSLSTNWGAGLSNLREVEALELRISAIDHEIEAERQETVRRIAALQDDLALQMERQRMFGIALQRNREFLDSTERLYLTGRKAWLDVLNAAREVAASEIAVRDAGQQIRGNAQLLRLIQLGPGDFLAGLSTREERDASPSIPINITNGDAHVKP